MIDFPDNANDYSEMAKFHLQLCINEVAVPDEDGFLMNDLQEARRLAITSLRDVAAADVQLGQLNRDMEIQILDPNGRMIDRVTFEEAVEVNFGSQQE